MDGCTRLLLAAADGDREALASFVARTQADVWRFCAHLVDQASADDLTQEVYLRAMSTLARFRAEASARTWLLSVARHVAADEIRRRQRARDVTGLVPPATAGASEEPGAVLALAQLLEGLEHGRREAFVLTQVLGLSYADAAIAADVPVGTIRSRVARARQQLIAELSAAETAGGADTGPADGTGSD